MKNIKLIIQFVTISLFIILLSGCTGSADKHFDKKPEFMQNAQYTRILKIVDKDIVKAIVNITYLNSADSKWDNGKQNFIIGTYIIDEDKECCKLDLTVLKEATIQLDKNNIEYVEEIVTPIVTKVISKDDSAYQNIPLRNNWAEYKLVSYDDKDFEDIEKLTFKFGQNSDKRYQEIAQGHNLTALLFWDENPQGNMVTTTFTKE